MTPTTTLPDPPVVGLPTLSQDVSQPESIAASERPAPRSWYAGPEFQRILMEHFTKARNAAIATDPPDMPG